MPEELQKTIDKTQITEEVAEQPEVKSSSGALSDLNRKISDEDLTNPAVGRLILDRNDQLEAEVKTLREYKEKYHAADKRADVLSERLTNMEDSIGSRNLLFLLGGILAGFLPTAWNYVNLFWADLVISILLIIGGFINLPKIIAIIKWKESK